MARERLLLSVRNYVIFLYVGTMVSTLAPRAAFKFAPDAFASAQRFAPAVFAAATLLLQDLFARVLKPSPMAARLTPLYACSLAVITWMCVTAFFINCLPYGDDGYYYGESTAAAVASIANLVMSAHTVMRHLDLA